MEVDVSVVVPFLNEQDSLKELASRLQTVLEKNNFTYELLFVDDGSSDNSVSVLLEAKIPNLKIIKFRRNYGKSAALSVGFKKSVGKIIVTMDADLQDDPNEIPNLIAKLNEGYDLVSGWKKKRNDPLNKTVPSKFFNLVTQKLTGIKIHDFNCGLKAYKSKVAKEIKVYGELHRFVPVLANEKGFRVGEVPVLHHERKFGTSKFGFERFAKGFLDLVTVIFITTYMKRPLHLFGMLGTLSFVAGAIIEIYLSIGWFFGSWIGNRPIFFVGILLLIFGLQFFSIGLIAEMITSKTFEADYSIEEEL
ncbi:glycosyltransferase family 2 protein [bacterium]|nr:glycosyltransferase family 2 protein [bacterium]